MTGLVFALFGLACIVYVMFILAVSFAGFLVIAWKLLWPMGRQLLLLFIRSPTGGTHREHSRKGHARSKHPPSKSSRTATAQTRGNAHHTPLVAIVGNDITIIAGDQTPGKALYSELDPPPRSKLAEN